MQLYSFPEIHSFPGNMPLLEMLFIFLGQPFLGAKCNYMPKVNDDLCLRHTFNHMKIVG